MYITDKFICFYSNLFGMEKKIRIPYSHITLITKEKTALVIPNAIAITTYRKEYIFRSLKSFIKKYKGISSSSSSAAATNGATTSPASTTSNDVNVPTSPPVSNTTSTTGTSDDSRSNRSNTIGSITTKKRAPTSTTSTASMDDNEVDTDNTDTTNSTLTTTNFEDECKSSKLKLVIFSGEAINAPLDVFLAKLIDDQASYSLKS